MEKINDSAVELINAIYDSTFFKESHDNNGDLHSIINLCRDVQKSYYNNADIYFRVYETEKNFVILYEALEKHKLVEKFAEHVENYKNSLIEDRTKYFSILLDIIEENEISKNNKRSIFIYG